MTGAARSPGGMLPPMRTSLPAILTICGVSCLAACAAPRGAQRTPAAPGNAPQETETPVAGDIDLSSPLDAVVPTNAAWYDASPLLVSMREPERVGLERAAGVARLEDLPLYDLNVYIDPDAGLFDLTEELWFTNREPEALREIHLRIYGNAEPEPGKPAPPPVVTMSSGHCVAVSCTVTSPSPSLLVVTPSQPVSPGGRLRIRLVLGGALPRRNPEDTGLIAQSLGSLGALAGTTGQVDYGLLSLCGGFVSLGNFYAVVARRRQGSWEKPEAEAFGDSGPDELSNVRARVNVPGLVRVVSPGVCVKDVLLPREQGRAARRRYDIGGAAVRNFALFASEGLRTITQRDGDITLRSTFREGNDERGARALDVARHALHIFEKRFGRYPWSDLDVVEAPLVGGAGGVEFTGLIAIAGMLYRPFESSDPIMRLLPALGVDITGQVSALLDSTLEFTTAHEVAHQWWYGLVGTDSRLHPFVDESLAQYSTIVYLEDRYGQDRARRDADANVRMNYVAMRMLGQDDAPVDRPVSSFRTPLAYAGLIYGKGPYLYRELRKALGDEKFFAALRSYVSRYRFRIAPGRGPVDELAAGADASRVRMLARRWLDERHGDTDLGPIDMTSMLTSVLGPDAARIAPAMEELLKTLETDR